MTVSLMATAGPPPTMIAISRCAALAAWGMPDAVSSLDHLHFDRRDFIYTPLLPGVWAGGALVLFILLVHEQSDSTGTIGCRHLAGARGGRAGCGGRAEHR